MPKEKQTTYCCFFDNSLVRFADNQDSERQTIAAAKAYGCYGHVVGPRKHVLPDPWAVRMWTPPTG